MTAKQTNPPDDLNGLQSWLQTAITTPWQADGSQLKQIVREGRGNLDAAQRLGIYAHAYQGRLVECMESEFPVLRLTLGTSLFVRFASEYLMVYPSQSYTLTALGERFPAYLRETRPENERELWPQFIIELATLERTFSEVYHGEGLEETAEKAASDTQTIAFEPEARRMNCTFPVDVYFIAARKHLKAPDMSEPPEFPEPEPVALLIFRRNYVVQMRRIVIDELPVGGNKSVQLPPE